jgi:MFS family permease
VATPNRVLAIVSVGMILANLDLFVVNVALPNIALDFANPSLERLSWILNGYAIAYAALLVFFGRLSERYPRNLSFLVGIGAFTAASAACAAATGTEMLIVFRVVQAASTSSLPPSSFATGSGAINMIRQVAMAVGVAVLVAILGEHHAVEEWVKPFRVAWWIMAAVTLIGLVPLLLIRPRPARAPVVSE